MNSAEIRKAFVKYFTQRGHTAIPGSSLIPGQDPSLLFTNAGMVQFKDVFLGRVAAPEAPAVTVQPCLRAGGKHNDLENVGYTARHHTLFEMLGNFSFGQYFKREAIAYAWEFLTQVLHLPENRLWVTVYESDDETANIWLHEMKVSPDRFSRCGAADNFWAMGETGPCGPCTEIFYDHGPSVAGGPPGSPDADGDRYTEIWNLVFMQYNRDAAGVLHPLPKPAVDTGMGLERIAAVMQGVHSNYDIDIFQHLIAAIRGLEPSLKKAKTENRTSQQAIADHMRSITFLMAEGVVPSNEGRGYVLRRILRRAVRHGNQLGLSSPFLARLFPAMLDVMGEAYPLLKQQEKTILYWIEQEEQQFSKTLVQGLRILQEAVRGLKTTVFSGEEAFKLYDTYGFPLDLTQDVLREQGISVDVDGFERCMEAQRALSQSNTAFQSQMVDNIFDGVGSSFEGYEHSEYESKILRIVVDGQAAVEASKEATIVLDATPFYPEGGGQVGDQGILIGTHGRFQVQDTQRVGEAIVHIGYVLEGSIQLAESVQAQIDAGRRAAIRCHHTATHMLHAVLRQLLGTEVQQKGSLVDADRARFDFSYPKALLPEQLSEIECRVNAYIRQNKPLETQHMNVQEACASGAMALFGEKYDSTVRVLSIGDFSKELCGGTHVDRTGDVGCFAITDEYGVASGVRRIEFFAGKYALAYLQTLRQTIAVAAERLKTTPAQLNEKIDQILENNKQQEKRFAELQSRNFLASSDILVAEAQKIGEVALIVKEISGADMPTLRQLLDHIRSKLPCAVVVLYAIDQQALQVVAHVNKFLSESSKMSAVDLVRQLCGKGGGRPDLAQGGGTCPTDLAERLKDISLWVQKNIKI